MNRIVFSLFLAMLSLVALAATGSEYLILGGSSNTAYALIKHLSVQKKPCTVFVRDPRKVKALFQQYDTIEYVQGNATEDAELLRRNAEGKKFIYIGQDFPFTIWEKYLNQLVDNVINASFETGATIIYPGRIYKYGLTNEITEESEPNPNSKQGEVLEAVEQKLLNAAIEKQCPVLIVRHSYPFGPGVKDGLMDNVFIDVPAGKPMKWIARTNIPQQLTFTPDLARFIEEAAEQTRKDGVLLETVNFAGHTIESMNYFGKTLCEVASSSGNPLTYQSNPHSYIAMSALALIYSGAQRGVDAFYSFDNSVMLSSSKQRELHPDFLMTPLNVALRQTMRWYKRNKSVAS